MLWRMPSTPARKPPWEPAIDGAALRRYRLREGLSQRELIDACWKLGTEVDKGNYHRAEQNLRGAIGFRKLAVVVKVLGIDMQDVLTEHGKKESGRRAA
jgi:hypothetical protein